MLLLPGLRHVLISLSFIRVFSTGFQLNILAKKNVSSSKYCTSAEIGKAVRYGNIACK